ncbi:MAG: DNA methyltransferase, partial [Sphaerospermopsis kisseleviana]
FCGSATTCLAARNLNRHYLGIEINPDYVNLANNRMAESNFQQQELFI